MAEEHDRPPGGPAPDVAEPLLEVVVVLAPASRPRPAARPTRRTRAGRTPVISSPASASQRADVLVPPGVLGEPVDDQDVGPRPADRGPAPDEDRRAVGAPTTVEVVLDTPAS